MFVCIQKMYSSYHRLAMRQPNEMERHNDQSVHCSVFLCCTSNLTLQFYHAMAANEHRFIYMIKYVNKMAKLHCENCGFTLCYGDWHSMFHQHKFIQFVSTNSFAKWFHHRPLIALLQLCTMHTAQRYTQYTYTWQAPSYILHRHGMACHEANPRTTAECDFVNDLNYLQLYAMYNVQCSTCMCLRLLKYLFCFSCLLEVTTETQHNMRCILGNSVIDT